MSSLVVIPTYNEAQNIKILVSEILKSSPEIEVVVVDDNSPDGTGEVADKMASEDKRVQVVHRPGKLGLGSAYLAGFNYALERDYQYIFTMDADLSHDARYLPAFFEKFKECDLVLGSRYSNGISVVNWRLGRLILSIGANTYLRLVTGMRFTDLTSGYRGFRREVLANINLEAIHSNGYAFIVETTFRAWKKNYRIGEVPIVFIDRQAGSSKLSKKDMLEAFLIPWRLRLGLYRK